MKLTFISDTHGFHKNLTNLKGEVIIHAGDVSNKGAKHEVEDFLDWFKELDFEYKIFIAGNHDFYFEGLIEKELEDLIPTNVIYLNDSGIKIKDQYIWGSPIQPWFFDWAFNRQRGTEIKKHWDLIPQHTDILVTHGPPYQILDKTFSGDHVGCEELIDKVKLVKPKIHAFGHIHEDYGMRVIDKTKFINASILDQRYRVVNSPIEVEL